MAQTLKKESAPKRGRSLIREDEVLKRLGIGRTKLLEDYVKTGRLTWVRVGPKIKAAVEDEVDTLVEEIIKEGRETADA